MKDVDAARPDKGENAMLLACGYRLSRCSSIRVRHRSTSAIDDSIDSSDDVLVYDDDSRASTPYLLLQYFMVLMTAKPCFPFFLY